jgi:hypothetical protein
VAVNILERAITEAREKLELESPAKRVIMSVHDNQRYVK